MSSTITISVHNVKTACLLGLKEIKEKENKYLSDIYFKRKNKYSWFKKLFRIKNDVLNPTQEQLIKIINSFSIIQICNYIDYTKSYHKSLLEDLLNMANLKYNYTMQLDKDDFAIIYPYLEK